MGQEDGNGGENGRAGGKERIAPESFERGRSRKSTWQLGGVGGRGVGKPINFTMANSETVATPFLQFTEVIKV